MKKLNKKYLLVLGIIVSIVFLNTSNELLAEKGYISGKVLYSDDLSPVNNGNVRVFCYSEISKTEIEIQSVSLNHQGEFKIFVPPLTANGIKIMAYPNEIDNISNPFEKKVLDYKDAMVNLKNSLLIINVERTDKKSIDTKNQILVRNFPNPFNPTTSISFELPKASKVTLKIYNMNGASVATLAEDKNLNEGLNEFEFNAGDLPSGIYIYRLNAGQYSQNGKMILVK